MKVSNDDEILQYYQREITYLRRMGIEFARKYPKIAGRLEIGVDQSPDPHVERMLESFAFLTGRIQKNIDSELPEVTSALLDILYPHYLHPVPAMAIARFTPDSKQGKLTTPYVIKKHTQLIAPSNQGLTLRFRTCYPVELLPLSVSFAGFESTDKYNFLDASPNVATVLRLRINALSDPLNQIDFTKLRFYMNGEKTLTNALFELLFGHCLNVALLPEGATKPVYLTKDALKQVGYNLDEEVVPYPGNSHPQYRLLQEYFAFPDKFLFFDIHGLEKHSSKKYVDILLLLDQTSGSRLAVNQDTFQLGCSPIINLFNKVSEPIRLDQRQSEYQIIPDSRRETSTEIYSIRSVSATSDVNNSTQVIEPFYSYNHSRSKSEQTSFWFARRVPTGRDDVPGTNMLLSLLDLQFKASVPPVQTIYAHTVCTNRNLAAQLPAGAVLQIEEPAPVKSIVTLSKPTQQIDSPIGSKGMWRLVSHLSLNYLSLSSEKKSLEAFREILKLYDFTGDPSISQQIMGIRELSTKPALRRMGFNAWQGFCRGTEITLTFDEDMYVGGSAFMFASVLNHYFALYTSINSFTELVIKSVQRKGDWKRWQPMVGEEIIL